MSLHRVTMRLAMGRALVAWARPCAPLVLIAAAIAAEPQGTLATRADGSAVHAGEAVHAAAHGVTRIAVAGLARGWIDLRPGTTLSLTSAPAADARPHLVVQLDEGAARFDLSGTGPYQDVQVRGAAVDLTVTGTMFVVERVQRDADYVALIRGHLSVGLRSAVAEALQQHRRVDLDSRQAINASASGGLGNVAPLSTTPELLVGSSPGADPGASEADLAFGLDRGGHADAEVVDALGDDAVETIIDELSSGGMVRDDILGVVGGGFGLGGPPPPP